MSQVMVQLPETLYSQLDILAKTEGVSLREYILYVLARQAQALYSMQPLSPDAVAEQGARFTELLETLGATSKAGANDILAQREQVEISEELPQEIRARVEQKIH
jgi:hypothetical protein